MELLGNANWWLPRWLDRVLPRVDVEGHEEPPSAEVGEVNEPVGADKQGRPVEVPRRHAVRSRTVDVGAQVCETGPGGKLS